MQLLRTISARAGAAGLPFFVIGGYAVMAHGFVRATDDLDLLAQAGRRQDWQRLVEDMGMTIYREAPTFLQFNPAPGGRLPLDIMFVADEAFTRMQPGTERTMVQGVSVGVVSLHQLIALKCHAIKIAETRRGNLRILKDTDDLIHLIQLNAVDLESGTSCSSMAPKTCTKSSNEPAPPTEGILRDTADLEFPDWSGHQAHPRRMSFEEACLWNEEMLRLFPPRPERRAERFQSKCPTPFEL